MQIHSLSHNSNSAIHIRRSSARALRGRTLLPSLNLRSHSPTWTSCNHQSRKVAPASNSEPSKGDETSKGGDTGPGKAGRSSSRAGTSETGQARGQEPGTGSATQRLVQSARERLLMCLVADAGAMCALFVIYPPGPAQRRPWPTLLFPHGQKRNGAPCSCLISCSLRTYMCMFGILNYCIDPFQLPSFSSTLLALTPPLHCWTPLLHLPWPLRCPPTLPTAHR